MGVARCLLGWIGLSLRPIVHWNRVLDHRRPRPAHRADRDDYQLVTGRSFTLVLFSGEDALPDLVAHAADYTIGVLILLIACKSLVYGLSLSAFRGGPVFPSMFIGAALGIAVSGLPGMTLGPP